MVAKAKRHWISLLVQTVMGIGYVVGNEFNSRFHAKEQNQFLRPTADVICHTLFKLSSL